MIHYVGESFLHIQDGFLFKPSEHFIFLEQGMLPCPLHVSCAFMGNLQDVPHFLCKCILLDPEKLIKIQSENNDVFGNAIILSSFTFTLSPLGQRFFIENIFFFKLRYKRVIYNSIPDSSINLFNKIFHSNLPKLIFRSRKQRWHVYRSTLPKR